MLQNLARCSYTRRATVNLAFGSPLSAACTPKRFYATRKNKEIIDLLNECAAAEDASVTGNTYKVRSFGMAVTAIKKLDFEVRHGNDLKGIKGVGPGIRSRINVFLGHEEEPPPSKPESATERFKRDETIELFKTIPGLGKGTARDLYDAGCDTIEKLHLEEYYKLLSIRGKKSLKYMKHLRSPAPREHAEAIVEFWKYFMRMDEQEVVIVGDFRREVSVISGPIELLVIDENALDLSPTPPHPSTLKIPSLHKPPRMKKPFLVGTNYMTVEEKATNWFLNKVIKPLEEFAVVSDTIVPGKNVWQGWVRVPKKGVSWESRKERMDGIQASDGDFHRVNITHIRKQSRGSALLALTGDWDYYSDCVRKAVRAGLYLDEWGLWRWEPESQSHSRPQTTDAPHEMISLGAMWGSETKADKGRWIRLDSTDEERILNAIGGEYVPPNKRNFGFIMERGPTKAKLWS